MTKGRILLADDNPDFALATAELLRGGGYEVDVVPDGDAARARLSGASYDLLISDLEMPGNDDLSLVRDVARTARGLPVIILTGFPTTRSAIASISLPVAAYLVKPVDLDELLRAAAAAVSHSHSWRQAGNGGADAFLALTLRNVMGSLEDLEHLSRAIQGQPSGQTACHLMNCPRGLQLQAAVEEAIQALEETKSAFKSRTLATLRQRLEAVLRVT